MKDYVVKSGDSFALSFKATDKKNYSAEPYSEAVTIDVTAFKDINAANKNYDVTVIPGNLTITQKSLTVTAHTGLTTKMGTEKDIKSEYDVDGVVGSDAPWSKAPQLQIKNHESESTGALTVGNYDLTFAKGTLKANGNYKIADDGYVIPDGANFVVTAADGSRIVVTVVPGKTKVYGSADPDWDKIEKDVDYYVSGLNADDNIKVTLTREKGEEADTYALTATATVDHPDWYAEGIVYNNSTFEITPKELTATIPQQIVVAGATDPADDSEAAWSVEGLVTGVTINGVEIKDTQEDLNGVLALDVIATVGTYDQGLKLTINNDNYTLKTGSEYGKLLVIDASTLVLNPNDADLVEKINTAADGTARAITFMDETPAAAAKELKAGQWNTLVLPFDTNVEEVSAALGYAVVDMLDTDNESNNKVVLKLAFGDIPAHTPFLVQPKTTIKLSAVDYWQTHTKEIVKVSSDEALKAADKGGHALVGTYEDITLKSTDSDYDHKYFYSPSEKQFAHTKSTTIITVFSAYLYDENDGQAPVFYIDEPDGSTTVIDAATISNNAVRSAEGWYNLNGVKLEGTPTEKGLYIKDGKKIVIK